MDRQKQTQHFIRRVEALNTNFVVPEKEKGSMRICTFNVHRLRTPLPTDFSGADTQDMVGNVLRNLDVDIALLQECASTTLLRNTFPFFDIDPATQLAIGSWYPLTKVNASSYIAQNFTAPGVLLTNVHLDVNNPRAAFSRLVPQLRTYNSQQVVAGDFNDTQAANWVPSVRPDLMYRTSGATCWANTEIDFIFTNIPILKAFAVPVTVSDHLPIVYDIKSI